jgi:hypothetical protein
VSLTVIIYNFFKSFENLSPKSNFKNSISARNLICVFFVSQAGRMKLNLRNAYIQGLVLCLGVSTVVSQDVQPEEMNFVQDDPLFQQSEKCKETRPAQITLPRDSTTGKVDVFFLFDDTGSFEVFVPTFVEVVNALIAGLGELAPGVDWGYGVGRFEDYGGDLGRTYGKLLDAGI